MGRLLKQLTFAVLLVALAIGVAQNRGLIEPRHLHQLHLLRGRLLQQPAVAAAVDRLRVLFPGLGALLPRPGEPSCSCGVSGAHVGGGRAAFHLAPCTSLRYLSPHACRRRRRRCRLPPGVFPKSPPPCCRRM